MKKFCSFLQSVGLDLLSKQCELDSDEDLKHTERYIQTLLNRVLSQENIHQCVRNLLRGLLKSYKLQPQIQSRSNSQINLSRKHSATELSKSKIKFDRQTSLHSTERKIKRTNSSSFIKNNTSVQSSSKKQTSRSKSREKHHLYDYSSKKLNQRNITSKIKELQELQVCSFKPQVNKQKNHQEKNVNTPVYDRLNQQARQNKLKQKNFEEYQKKQDEEMKNCTFRPKINKENVMNSSSPAFERLYKDGKQRQKMVTQFNKDFRPFDTNNSQINKDIQRGSLQSNNIQEIEILNSSVFDRIKTMNSRMDSILLNQNNDLHIRQISGTPTATFATRQSLAIEKMLLDKF